MSRIGKNPITIPAGVTLTLTEHHVMAQGPLGMLEKDVPRFLVLTLTDNILTVAVKNVEEKDQKMGWGLWRTLISNMIVGVATGFSKKLEINGVGYKAVLQGEKLVLHVGFSHHVEFVPPHSINVEVAGNIVTVTGIDKQMVGETAAKIRRIKKPEPYKGKGIKYVDEVIRRKAGKTVKSGA